MNFFTNLLKNPTITVAETEQAHKKTVITGNVTPGDWFTSKEHYLEFRAAFKAYASDKNKRYGLTSAHFLVYSILRNRDWTKSWTYPTHPGKQVEHVAKKATAFTTIRNPWWEEHLLKPFDGTITTEMLMVLRENLDEYRNQ